MMIDAISVSAAVVAVAFGLIAVGIGAWFTWTAHRLDSLHLRCEAARAMLEHQALRRSVAAQELASSGGLGDPASALLVSDAALATREEHETDDDRWQAESDLTAALHAVELPSDGSYVGQVVDAARRLTMARRIHNDAVVLALSLRSRRRVRWFRLAGHAAAPSMVAFDDRIP